ncbi:MAG: DNA cytosine methyltransferase [Acidobacteriia bacterium]|nr:DNA cytosine methyltransferase [Terriglobia bacterium]
MPIVAFDVFCGAGGVTYGLRTAGIRVAVGVDKEEVCRLTYTQNNPSAKFLCEDIRKLSAPSLLSHGASVSGDDFLLLAACAPCQPFSPQNQNRRDADDRPVIRHVERLVHDLRPDFLLIENVPGLRRIPGFSAFRRLLGALRVLKYKVRFGVIDAAWYGVPQHRQRLVLTASLHGDAPWPDQTHGGGPGLAPFITVRQAISKYPPLRAGEEHPTVPNHFAALLEPHNLERLRATPRDGGSRNDWPSDLVLECHKKHDSHPDVYGRLQWDAPAPTLTTRCTSLSNGRYGHPEQDRAISAREAAALQSFDDTYMFYGGLGQITRQIGNAVPPVLAEKFGAAFVTHAEQLSGRRKKPLWRAVIERTRLVGSTRQGRRHGVRARKD